MFYLNKTVGIKYDWNNIHKLHISKYLSAFSCVGVFN